jgi:hypothetical protein
MVTHWHPDIVSFQALSDKGFIIMNFGMLDEM